MKKQILLLLVFVLYNYLSPAQWQQTNGPYGETINCFAVSNNNIFAGTEGEGVFLSTDNGSTWIAVNNVLIYKVKALAISGTNIFAGTAGSGVFLSTNNGGNWIAVNNGLSDSNIRALAISGTNIFAGTDFIHQQWKQLDCCQ
ncbi:MAG: hypothetical protein HY738_02200 [Bacteroidia bacterium]|nr:hypothetical protein [Bacteroidia bacterium]